MDLLMHERRLISLRWVAGHSFPRPALSPGIARLANLLYYSRSLSGSTGPFPLGFFDFWAGSKILGQVDPKNQTARWTIVFGQPDDAGKSQLIKKGAVS